MSVLDVPEGQRILQVSQAAPGAKPDTISDGLYYQVGQALAAMHQAQVGFTSAQPRVALDFTTLLERPLAIVRPLLAHRPADWAYLCQLAAKVQTNLNMLEGLEIGVCHGDPTLDNLHCTAEGQIIYYDFDQCGPGWLAYDLQGVFRYAQRLPRASVWESFLRGYQTRRQLSPGEIQAMPYFVVLNEYWCMGFEAGTVIHSRGAALINDGYFSALIDSWKAWEAQYLG
jgi:Ser/Thr protein kinase RdoA (MazF antagonist)